MRARTETGGGRAGVSAGQSHTVESTRPQAAGALSHSPREVCALPPPPPLSVVRRWAAEAVDDEDGGVVIPAPRAVRIFIFMPIHRVCGVHARVCVRRSGFSFLSLLLFFFFFLGNENQHVFGVACLFSSFYGQCLFVQTNRLPIVGTNNNLWDLEGGIGAQIHAEISWDFYGLITKPIWQKNILATRSRSVNIIQNIQEL
jgi:hypothetical protein